MAGEIIQLSNDLASIAESAGASVARVDARGRLAASGIIWSADGVIVTSHHVVERDDNITVGLPNGESVSAALVGRDPTTDLAVLRVESQGLAAAKLAEADSLRVGHLVLALGRPGRTVQATLGVISAYGDSWRSPSGGRVDRYLQTDVAMYPGFSGGPLVTASGEVAGLNTSGILRGVSLTIPASTIRSVVETILQHGKVRRGYLGVGAQPARLPEALARQLEQETGLLLVSVESNSPAEQHGLVLGDTLVALDGQPVRSIGDLLSILSGDKVGVSVTARIVRGGEVRELSVVVGEHA